FPLHTTVPLVDFPVAEVVAHLGTIGQPPHVELPICCSLGEDYAPGKRVVEGPILGDATVLRTAGVRRAPESRPHEPIARSRVVVVIDAGSCAKDGLGS